MYNQGDKCEASIALKTIISKTLERLGNCGVKPTLKGKELNAFDHN